MLDTVVALAPESIPVCPTVQHALTEAVAELRAEIARLEAADGRHGDSEGGATPRLHTAEAARVLRHIAERLELQGAWATTDRLVHELLSGLITDALDTADGFPAARLTGRAFALRVLARQAPLWPGAGPRLGCAYGYDSLIAVVRTAAQASFEDPVQAAA